MLNPFQTLCEQVRWVLASLDEVHRYVALRNDISNEMLSNVEVLRSRMENRIADGF